MQFAIFQTEMFIFCGLLFDGKMKVGLLLDGYYTLIQLAIF